MNMQHHHKCLKTVMMALACQTVGMSAVLLPPVVVVYGSESALTHIMCTLSVHQPITQAANHPMIGSACAFKHWKVCLYKGTHLQHASCVTTWPLHVLLLGGSEVVLSILLLSCAFYMGPYSSCSYRHNFTLACTHLNQRFRPLEYSIPGFSTPSIGYCSSCCKTARPVSS